MIITLQCETGHMWQREAARGRRPRYCPEHAPAPLAPEEKPRAKKRAAVLADFTGHDDLADYWRAECANPAACEEHAAEYRQQMRTLSRASA